MATLSAPPAPVLRVRDLATHPALDGVSLDVRAGEIVVIVGAAACGQSTFLRVVAGEVEPDEGAVELRGVGPVATIERLPAGCRALDAVAEVVPGRDPVQARAALDRLDAADLADRLPHELAASQRLRVALARGLATGADVVLLDEPTADVDPRWRRAVRAELVAVQRRLRFTAVVVTHDQAEAMQLADRLVVMERGRILQSGLPGDVYRDPVSRSAAVLTGTVNEVPGWREGRAVRTPVGALTGRSGADAAADGDPVIVLWRPEHLRLSPAEPDGPNRFTVMVEASLYLGAHSQHVVRAGEHRFLVWQEVEPEVAWFPREGARVWAQVDPGDVRVLPRP